MDKLLGGKPWYESLTVWGVIIISTAQTFVTGACDPEAAVLGAAACGILVKGLTLVGGILTTFGIRKAATAKNAA